MTPARARQQSGRIDAPSGTGAVVGFTAVPKPMLEMLELEIEGHLRSNNDVMR